MKKKQDEEWAKQSYNHNVHAYETSQGVNMGSSQYGG